jgi:hypothetical protein
VVLATASGSCQNGTGCLHGARTARSSGQTAVFERVTQSRYAGGEAVKAYVITTGVVFGLLTIAHLVRMVVENGRLATEPEYLIITACTAALCAWAVVVLRRAKV